ncbi:MAG: D-alanyl-D-alanine carboxypeptidase [Lachnospiraceae bacterium]|nr:D-alanyl-D-alanine carboxypeptidase [Lachnospiraceae bacterium]
MLIKKIRIWAAAIVSTAILLGSSLTAYATPIDYNALQEARKTLPVQSNEIPGWPQGPEVGAQAAILMDAETGAILYAKGIDEKLYPASTTKIMTCLLAVENCDLDEMVTFSHEAVFSIERGSSNIGMDEGESITMNDALNGILILSANEVANAVGEHVAGDAQSFVDMMNAKAAELGCTNTHFMNAHGLHDDNHYTTARDLATIARAFFSHDVLANISGTTYCTFEATATQPDSFSLATKNQLVEGKEYEYEWLVGSKTGFTSQSRQTLVSCAKKDGMELICVVLMEESPYQFTDTIALFNYGFENFHKINIAEHETAYTMENTGFLESGSDIFGNSQPFMTLANDTYVIVPNSVNFEDLSSKLVYDTDYANAVAEVQYFYNDNYVGETYVKVSGQTPVVFDNLSDESSGASTEAASGNAVSEANPNHTDLEVSSEVLEELISEQLAVSEENAEENAKPVTNEDEDSVFINVKAIIIIVVAIAAVVIGILLFKTISENYHFARRRIARRRRKRRRTKYDSSEFKNLKF